MASAFKLSLRYLDYIQLLLYSTLVSIFVLSFILALRGKTRLLFSYSGSQYLRSLVLGSTVIWALYWIYNTKDDRDPVAGLLLNFFFGLPWVLASCLLFSNVQVSNPLDLVGAASVGVFEMGITFVLWLSALKLSENTAKVGNLIFLSPFLSLVFIHFLVGEVILPSTFTGLALIVAGLFIQRLKGRPI